MRIIKLSIGKTGFCLCYLLIASLSYGQSTVEVYNKGVPGNSVSDLLNRLDKDVLGDPVDLCVIMVGTNDLLNTSKMVTLNEFGVKIRSLLELITQSGIRPVLVSPPPVDTVYLFQRHDRSRYPYPPNQLLEMARDSISGICAQENIAFIDLFTYLRNEDIPEHNRDTVIQNERNSQVPDGVHFTAYGNEILAAFVFKKLLEWQLISNSVRVLCFGDSLTYGVRMQGAGTATGETYPAYLKNQIIDWIKENK